MMFSRRNPPAQPLNKGFTIIELLVVFTIIAIVSTITMASFVSYGRRSTLQQAASDVSSLIRDAKYRTQSQIKPSTCSGPLGGYQVDICGLTASTCDSPNAVDTYSLSILCSGVRAQTVTKKLPANVHFTNTGTTSVSFLFNVLSNGVTGTGAVVLTGYGSDLMTVTVGNGGTLSIQ